MTVSYSFETKTMTNIGGEKKKESKSIVDGDLGIKIFYLKKTDSDFKRIRAEEKDGKFTVVVKKGEDENSQEMDEKEFLKMAKNDEDLDFVVSYMKKRIRGGARRVKRTSKKTSKKTSKVVRRVRKA